MKKIYKQQSHRDRNLHHERNITALVLPKMSRSHLNRSDTTNPTNTSLPEGCEPKQTTTTKRSGNKMNRKIQGTLCFASFIAAAIAGGGLEESNASISWYWFGIFFTTTIFLLPRREQFSSRKGNNK